MMTFMLQITYRPISFFTGSASGPIDGAARVRSTLVVVWGKQPAL